MDAVSLKVVFDDETRRFSVPSTLSFEGLCTLVRQRFSSRLSGSFTISYIDDEDDLITVASDSELEECLRIAREFAPGKAVRIVVRSASPSAEQEKLLMMASKLAISDSDRLLIAPVVRTMLTGAELLRNPRYNKGTAFSKEERRFLRLEGLIPAISLTQQERAEKAIANIRRKTDPLDKYNTLTAIMDSDLSLFYYLIINYIMELMPVIYTPTVGQACIEYNKVYRKPQGLWITLEHRGYIRDVLRNWPESNIRCIVVTDGERILGLGDLGAHGMGIPVGKLALYTACAGVEPSQCLPITLDVGTNNQEFLQSSTYIGLRQPRATGDAYDSFIEEFITSVVDLYGPNCLIQFEDFGNANAFKLLNRYRDRVCTFNDDIQGTSAVTLAGLYGALKITKKQLQEQKILMVGAGEAGLGIADLIVFAMCQDNGLTPEQARDRIWFVDSKGLIVNSRTDLTDLKRAYAKDFAFLTKLDEIVAALKPNAIVGVSAQGGIFTQAVIENMAACNANPIIFALSNPTSKSECTAQQAYEHTNGTAIFASGSPFDPIEYKGKKLVPGQGNNAYIFPGMGMGIVSSGALHVPDLMFYAAAKSLAAEVQKEDLDLMCVYPTLTRIREVSSRIAAAVADVAYEQNLATLFPRPADMSAHITKSMYDPTYRRYL